MVLTPYRRQLSASCSTGSSTGGSTTATRTLADENIALKDLTFIVEDLLVVGVKEANPNAVFRMVGSASHSGIPVVLNTDFDATFGHNRGLIADLSN